MQLYRLESLRKILLYLQKQPEVVDVILEEEKYMHIKFDDNFIEHWFYDDLPTPKFYGRWYRLPDNVMYPFNNKYPEFRCQFSRSPDDPDYDLKGKFFLYTPKFIKEYMFCNVRLFLHRLARDLEQEGYVEPWLPQEEINKIVKKLDKQDWARHKIDNKTYKVQPTTAKLSRPLIVLQNSDLDIYWKKNGLFVTLDLLYRKKWPITRSNIIWYMRKRRKARYDVGHPTGLATILKEYYRGMPVVNHTEFDWVRTAAIMCSVPCISHNNNLDHIGQAIHISEHPTGHKDEIILNDGDCKIIGPRPDNQDFIYLRISKHL